MSYNYHMANKHELREKKESKSHNMIKLIMLRKSLEQHPESSSGTVRRSQALQSSQQGSPVSGAGQYASWILGVETCGQDQPEVELKYSQQLANLV